MSMRRPSYANVTATIALVVALCGGAYAAGIGRNDVKSKNIAPKAVKSSDLASKAVKAKKIGNDAVTGDKVVEGTLGTVPNADALDGLDSAALLKGSGRVRSVRISDVYSGAPSGPVDLAIGGTITAECLNPGSGPSDVHFTNTSSGPLDVWIDRFQDFGTMTMVLDYASVPPGGEESFSISGPSAGDGHNIGRFTISTGDRVTLVEARVISGPTACEVPLLISELGG
jgi:hypothetical protein